MNQTKLFTKGMNKDLDYKMSQEEVYLDAHNIVILNDAGGTSMSLNNIKGNLLNGGIPDTPRLQKVTITGDDGGTTLSTLTISGPFGSETGTPWDTTKKSYKDLYDYINKDPAYANLHTVYEVYYGDNYLVVMSLINPTTVLNDITSTNFLNSSPKYVDAQKNLKIIGSTNIRNDIYLFTTNSEDKTPSGTVGQIWKYTYDKINLTSTIELKYNNHINFSTYWCIAPTAALGRYENGSIQRIYWTDNYNKLRTLNVANSQSLAVDPSVLDIIPAVDFDIPILTSVGVDASGVIKIGAYQCAYRLKNTGGKTTGFSELSNIVFIGTFPTGGIFTPTSPAWWKASVGDYGGQPTGQSIKWVINNIDRNFDRIEVVVTLRESLTGTPVFYVLPDIPIISDSINVHYDGSVQALSTIISLNEFLALSGIFTHCKTIATKDNRLFVANIRNKQPELNFDCRAFRSKSSSTEHIWLVNNDLETEYDLSGAEALDEGEDCINDYNEVIGTNPCYYKPNSNNFGGAGLHVSYEFVTIATACDRAATGHSDFSVADQVVPPWRFPNPNYTTDYIDLGVNSVTNFNLEENQKYTNIFSYGKTNAGFKFQGVNGLLRGYERNEIYRFGIQFYDKSKNPYFVKWIGDIKMPDFWENNNNPLYEDGTAAPYNDFRLSFTANRVGYNECFVQSLGIKFTIKDLETISDKIDGYSIVRVKREDKDKTIVCSGMLFPAVLATGLDGQVYMTSLTFNPCGNSNKLYANDLPSGHTYSYTMDEKRMFFVTPNIMQGTLQPASGNKLVVSTLLNLTNPGKNYVLNTGGGDPYGMFKHYDGSEYSDSIDISIVRDIDYNHAYNDGTYTVNNWDIGYDGGATPNPTDSLSFSMGNRAYYFVSTGGTIDFNSLSNNFKKYFATVTRELPFQYEGNTYTARANNEYIKCSHYRPIRTTSIPTEDTFNCYGGDVFVNMYDSCRWAKNLGTNRGQANWGIPRVDHAFSATFYFAVESPVNTDLRHQHSMNMDFASSLTSTDNLNYEVEFVEQYVYNTIYSAEDNIKTYFPKPDPFILNEEFDNRFYASEIKINGELNDSWGLFKETNYWDVEGTYGPINAISILQDKLYFWQNRAFGLMQVNPRAVTTDVNNDNNPQLQLTTGLPLQRHDYISTEVGLQHQWGTTKSTYKLFWMDVANKKFFSYSPGQQINPESDIKGMFSYFNNNLNDDILKYDKPTYFSGIGVRAVYDFKYNQAIFTFIDGDSKEISNQYTLAFNEFINSFTSFYDFTPRVYFTDGYKIFTTDNYNQADSALSNIYIHDSGDYNNFYSTVFPSTIKFVFNKDPLNTKTFDNIKYDSQAINTNNENQNDKTWTSIRLYNDYQNTDYQSLVLDTNIKRKERTFKLAIPRNRVLYTSSNSPNIFTDLSPTEIRFANRMRDKYIVVDMTFDNPDNLLLTTNNMYCEMRESAR